MGTNAQVLGHTRPPAATVLAGVLRRDRYRSLTGTFCVAYEDAGELIPPGIADTLGEVVVPQQVGGSQVFQINGVVGVHKCQRRLVVVIATLALDVLIRAGQQLHRLCAAVAPLRATTHATLRPRQALLSPAVVARIL